MDIPSGVHLPRPILKRPRVGEGIFDRQVVERLLRFRSRRIEQPTKIEPIKGKPRLKEALTTRLKNASIDLHLSKAAFSEATEAQWTVDRVTHGEAHRCRCWVLITEDETVLAACTLRFNPFIRAVSGRGKHWVQVMNVSANPEGRGYGTMMFEMLEMVLRREGICVVVLYPANNTCAPRFWGKLGFKERGGDTSRPSLLPEVETLNSNGNIIPEVDANTGFSLPRWEKDLTVRTLPRRDAGYL